MPMPRILKVMPEFWSDPRLETLKEVLKSPDTAIAKSLRWFSMACDHYAADEVVSEEKFRLLGCPELEGVGFAIRLPGGGYRAAGDHEHFKWLKSKQDNGSKGGLAKAARLASSSVATAPLAFALANPGFERRTKNEERRTERITLVGSRTSHPPSKFNDHDLILAERWKTYAGEVSKTIKPNVEQWADEIRKMREIDGVPAEAVEAMLAFVQNDSFWRANAISLKHLRSRSKNGLMKHENIRNSMPKESSPNVSWYESLDLTEFK